MSITTPKFCVSILPKTLEQLTDWISNLEAADIVEVRLDYLRSINIRVVKDLIKIPIIVTIRSVEEGGYFAASKSVLVNLYQQAIDAGVGFLDIDYQNAAVILPKLKLNLKTKLILSCHSQENKLDALKGILNEMKNTKANVYKLVFKAYELNDNRMALYLIDYAKELNIQFVIHAQGDEGTLSRILGNLMGNSWTYVSLDDQSQTAPGQLSIHQAKGKYYLPEKNQNCCLIGLVGFPVSQSKGWLIYNRLFHLLRSDKSSDNSMSNSIYLNFSTKSLSEFWKNWHDKLDGLSVTIPHKENILQFADIKSKEVALTGVCNTLAKRNGKWYAYNTDYLAIFELLKPFQKLLLKKSVLVYGTGATARSVIVALKKLDVQNLLVMGRNKTRGQFLKKLFSITFSEKDSDLPELSAIIQATPVGMYPNSKKTPDCAKLLKKGMIAFDVIFNPPITQFLKSAKEKGCRLISGEEMYFQQAIRQFELFTGHRISLNYFVDVWKDLLTN